MRVDQAMRKFFEFNPPERFASERTGGGESGTEGEGGVEGVRRAFFAMFLLYHCRYSEIYVIS